MASFETINYSLRPSKNIQRQLVFDGVRQLQAQLDLDEMAYVGFGSIWFTDFVLAHKILGIDDMVSIENKDVGFTRAVFNAPFATVRVLKGLSTDVLPDLYVDKLLERRPWLVWLDFDYDFNESVRDDLSSLIEHAPANTILLTTFNGLESKYGAANDRPGRLRELFGDSVPDELGKADCKDDRLRENLADLALAYMKSTAADLARPGGFVPAFRLIYQDGAPMVTVGGVLPPKGAVGAATSVVSSVAWPCRPDRPIVAPHLTLREAVSLQSTLPRPEPLSRTIVRKLGFDLEDDQIAAFERYYRQYPAFAQIVA